MNDDERRVGIAGLHSIALLSEPGQVVAGRLVEAVLSPAPNSPSSTAERHMFWNHIGWDGGCGRFFGDRHVVVRSIRTVENEASTEASRETRQQHLGLAGWDFERALGTG